MIKKMLLVFLCFTLFLSIPGCKKKLPTQPDIPTKILPTIEYFTATPESISPGESFILSWSVKNATNVTIDQDVGTVSATDTVEVSPEETTTYTLTATNSDGNKTQSCTIEVVAGVESIVVISSSNMLYIGASETFTAVATMTDGSSKAVIEGVWSEDNPGVAMVEAATGQVTIVGSGLVNIFVDYAGQQGSKSIRGLPNYQGTWSGNYIFTSCSATEDHLLVDFCDESEGMGEILGQLLPVELNLIQVDDRVEGHVLFYEMSLEALGPIQTDGRLLLTGTAYEVFGTIEVAMIFQAAVPGQITGDLSHRIRIAGLSGHGQLDGSIQELSRISTMAMSLRSVPQKPILTLKDLVRALKRR